MGLIVLVGQMGCGGANCASMKHIKVLFLEKIM